MIAERKIGNHRVVMETEDMFSVHFAAIPTEAEVHAIVDCQVELSEGRPVLLLLDLSHMAALPAPIRRAIAEETAKMNYKGIGAFGASFHVRVMAQLINNAIGLFKKKPFPQGFFDSREAALAWFDELRQRTG